MGNEAGTFEISDAKTDTTLFVWGAMSPVNATEEGVCASAQMLLSIGIKSPRRRAEMAASLLRGWVTHHDDGSEEVDVLAWHRVLCGVSVQVGRAA